MQNLRQTGTSEVNFLEHLKVIKMRIKYQRVSAFQQTGNRFEVDKDQYYLILFVKLQIDLI